MSAVGPQLQKALKALGELRQTDPELAIRIHRAASESLTMIHIAPLQPEALATISWPAEPTEEKAK